MQQADSGETALRKADAGSSDDEVNGICGGKLGKQGGYLCWLMV
jgi:hypothetical protein